MLHNLARFESEKILVLEIFQELYLGIISEIDKLLDISCPSTLNFVTQGVSNGDSSYTKACLPPAALLGKLGNLYSYTIYR